MYCTRCRTHSDPSDSIIDNTDVGGTQVSFCRCSVCSLCVGIKSGETWHDVGIILKRLSDVTGWLQVKTHSDRLVHHILSQILYREYEPPDGNQQEAAFDLPDPGDIIKIYWVNGKAVAFYTLKPKGTLIKETLRCYTMVTVDTVYVRKSHRRRGICSGMLVDVTQSYPNQDVAFAKPVSSVLRKVLEKFLSLHREYQNIFWEIQGAGEEGNRQLVWYNILRANRKRKLQAASSHQC